MGKEDFLENSHVLSWFVQLKSVLFHLFLVVVVVVVVFYLLCFLLCCCLRVFVIFSSLGRPRYFASALSCLWLQRKERSNFLLKGDFLPRIASAVCNASISLRFVSVAIEHRAHRCLPLFYLKQLQNNNNNNNNPKSWKQSSQTEAKSQDETEAIQPE